MTFLDQIHKTRTVGDAQSWLHRYFHIKADDVPSWAIEALQKTQSLLDAYELEKNQHTREAFANATVHIRHDLSQNESTRLVLVDWLVRWSLRLSMCYRLHGNLDDNKFANAYLEECLKITPPTSFEALAFIRINISINYIDRTSRDSEEDFLASALMHLNIAENLVESANSKSIVLRTSIFWAKSDVFGLQYAQEHALKQLDDSIIHLQAAVALHMANDRNRESPFTDMQVIQGFFHLISHYRTRLARSTSEDRDYYIEKMHENGDILLKLIRASSQPDPLLHDWILISIRDSFSPTALKSISQEQLDKSVQRFESALDDIPSDDSRKFMYLGAYAQVLSRLPLDVETSNRTKKKNFQKIKQIISKCLSLLLPLQALDYKSELLEQFGHIYLDQLLSERDPSELKRADLDAALDLFLKSVACEDSRPLPRIRSALAAGRILGEREHFKEAVDVYEKGIHLIGSIEHDPLTPSDQQYVIEAASGLSSEAASMALSAQQSKHRALLLLELGRGIMGRLHAKLNTSSGRDSQTFREPTLEGDKSGEALIRKVMKAVGGDSVIIVNVSFFRSDAFMISEGRISHIELKKMHHAALKEAVAFHEANRPKIWISTLSLLWFYVGEPILSHPHFSTHTAPHHVYWILAGSMSQLPMHAAGDYRRPGCTVMDRVISSYSSSLSAFIASRSRRINMKGSKKAFLLDVSKPSSDSSEMVELPFVKKEASIVRALWERPSVGLELIEARSNNQKDILATIQSGDIQIFHFAGHGFLHPVDPSLSGLVLHDGSILTVSKLRESDLNVQGRTPFLAYLSACSTGTNDAERLMDEGIHLIGACQLLGFRHVIGTIWQASDSRCAIFAKKVYTKIAQYGWTDHAVAQALHETLLDARNKWIQNILVPTMFEFVLTKTQAETNQDPNPVIIELGSYCRLMNSESFDDVWFNALKAQFPRIERHIWSKPEASNASKDEKSGTQRHVKRPKATETFDLGNRPEDVVVRADWIPFVHYG
jgi:tetratricopeptide (TPR) repeat protein